MPIIQRVSAVELCEIFNSGGYLERVGRCEYSVVVLEERHPSPPMANEPVCTWSRMLSYRERVTDEEVARVHQYDRPDGTIGLSGLPDPKRVLRDGILYRLHRKAG